MVFAKQLTWPTLCYYAMFATLRSTVLFASALSIYGAPSSQQLVQNRLDGVLNPYPGKPRTTFKKDGTFKLTVFSDLHYGENPWEDWGPEQDRKSSILLNKVLKDEKPDFAVINGDLVTGENTFRENVTRLIDEIVLPFNNARIPFAVTHGNHDNQANVTHAEEIAHMNKVSPFSYTRAAPPGVGGYGGPGNYWVPVYKKLTDRSPVLVLWFFDSRGGVHPNPNATEAMPDWVDSTVGSWIKSETQKMEKVWGPADSRAAVAFVHIPPHTIQSVQPGITSDKNPGLNDDQLGNGSVQDSASVGNDAPFYDSLTANVKNLHAIISGHDHGNEWCAREPSKKVIFCFNKHSGYGGYDSDGWGHGVRNLFFHTPDPKAAVETWIRLEEGETKARVVLDKKYDTVN